MNILVNDGKHERVPANIFDEAQKFAKVCHLIKLN